MLAQKSSLSGLDSRALSARYALRSRSRRRGSRQKPNSSCLGRIFPQELPFLPARKVSLFPRHDSARVYHVEEGERNQHGQRVEAVLISLLVGNAGVQTVRVFDEPENDPNLHGGIIG